MKRDVAWDILNSMMSNESLIRHSKCVALVMEAYAETLSEDKDEWYIAGLLHDADYEKYPDKHPDVIVDQLLALKENKIAYAISAHYTYWGKEYTDALEKYLLAVDELTGFVIATSLMRPTLLEGMNVKSVKKKLKIKGFAAGVNRREIEQGLIIAGLNLDDHIAFIIRVLQKHKKDLNLPG